MKWENVKNQQNVVVGENIQTHCEGYFSARLTTYSQSDMDWTMFVFIFYRRQKIKDILNKTIVSDFYSVLNFASTETLFNKF